MFYRNLKLTPMLRSLLDLCGETFSAEQIKAEVQLLGKDIDQMLTDQFHRAIQDSSFTLKYAKIINLSPRPIGSHGYEDMFRSLCSSGQGLILKGMRREAGLLWTRDTELLSTRDHFRPFPVDAGIELSDTYRFTRRDVATWDRAAAFVPDNNIAALITMLRQGKHGIRSVVAAEGGVMVLFAVQARDYQKWHTECQRLFYRCQDAHLKIAKFSMHTLVPISREARGRGSLLFLA